MIAELQSGPTVDKRANLSHEELVSRYVERRLPVVIQDGTRHWRGMGKITPDYLRKKYGHLSKRVDGRDYTVAEVSELIQTSTPENPAPYPFNLNVEHYFPELLEEFSPDIVFGRSDRIKHPLLPGFLLSGTQTYELFMGGYGSRFPYLHVDLLALDTQITQLHGTKEFILYPPDQTPYLYPFPDNPLRSQVNIFEPDLEKFPNFRKAVATRVRVEPGESILFPTGWWHTTQIHGPSISFGRVHVNRANWNAFVDENFALWRRNGHSWMLSHAARLYSQVLGNLMNLQEQLLPGRPA
ncbi:MAG: cupin-like domain-containing protein [Verrucomicrobiales bacterium]|nr:cupin-like domain-containing protein [Verrucomicrobiales bacterium]